MLAVVLAGKGVAALQEAGLIGVTPVDVPRISMLGLFPTLAGASPPSSPTLAILLAGFAWNRRRLGGPARRRLTYWTAVALGL